MKEENVINFYLFCNKLKNVIRTGWKVWHVQAERLESVAEHIWGTQMLAIAMYSEFHYSLDLQKVILMIAVHETEEIIIGDLTCNDENYGARTFEAHKAVAQIFGTLSNAKQIENLVYEFDECKTQEAKFSYFCDKLECDIQCKIYDEKGFVDMANQIKNPEIEDLKNYANVLPQQTVSYYWLEKDRRNIKFDENFEKISYFLTNNKIIKKD